jgi:hypothetical protein
MVSAPFTTNVARAAAKVAADTTGSMAADTDDPENPAIGFPLSSKPSTLFARWSTVGSTMADPPASDSGMRMLRLTCSWIC